VSTQTYLFGQEVQHKEQTWLVVRVIEKSTSLFENEDGTLSKVEESYAQLRNAKGEFDFVMFYERSEVFERHSVVKGIPPVPWRKVIS
jgi:hypothetical protein